MAIQGALLGAGLGLAPVAVAAPPAGDDPYALTMGGRVGYLDRAGKVVIAPQFDEGAAFSDGRAVVLVDRSVTPEGALTGGQYGAIDRAGTLVVPAKYRSLKPFSEGRAAFTLKADRGAIGGYVDLDGREIYTGATGRVMPFSDGLAAVEVRRDRWIFIDRAGQEVFAVPPEGDMRDPAEFSEGRLVLQVQVAEGLLGAGPKARRTWVLDRTGKRLLDLPHRTVRDRSEGLYAARDPASERWGYLDDSGAWALPPVHRFAGSFQDGVAVVTGADGRKALMARDGSLRCAQAEGVDLDRPSEGRARFIVPGAEPDSGPEGRRVGYLDAATCAVVVPPTWGDAMSSAQRYRGGLALVRRAGPGPVFETYIDLAGKPVRPLEAAVWTEKPTAGSTP